MNSRLTICIAAFVGVCLVAGCTRVVVHKDPDDCNKGIRYYRPKPYLFITPSGGGGDAKKPALSVIQNEALKIKTTSENSARTPAVTPAAYQVPPSFEELSAGTVDSTGQPSKECVPLPSIDPTGQGLKGVSIKMVYMPDFSEEYAIQLKPGLGIGELNIKLEEGWKLTSVGMKTDQQTDEIIGSVADLVGSLGSALGGAPTKDEERTIAKDIYATNVPFGFYEAVIATDPCGRKQLYGWRYVGFMPFQSCPVQAGGMQQVCCNFDGNKIYGLVWIKGVLQFRHIGSVEAAQPVAN